MRTVIAAVLIAGFIEGFVGAIIERRRVARVIAETNAALAERADEIDAKRVRMVEREHSAVVNGELETVPA